VDIGTMPDRNGAKLDKAPPQPPRQGKSLMSMAGGDAPTPSGGGAGMMNPAIKVMAAMGNAKKALLELSTMLPTLAQGIQQIITGLEQVVPQQVADMVAGNPPGSGGAGMGAPQANAAPTAPPVQAGMP
jgi:hypothetical protein